MLSEGDALLGPKPDGSPYLVTLVEQCLQSFGTPLVVKAGLKSYPTGVGTPDRALAAEAAAECDDASRGVLRFLRTLDARMSD
jgi:hypothetical protein